MLLKKFLKYNISDYECEKCKRKDCDATVNEKIYHLLRALLFQIKRTYYCFSTKKFIKSHSPIYFDHSLEIVKNIL